VEGGSAGRANRTVVIAAGLASLDLAVVTVALPLLGQDLHSGISGLQWTVVAFAVGVVALSLLGPVIGDRLDLRRALLAGLVAYSAASIGCALSPTIEVLVAARLVQGAGAGLVIPAVQPLGRAPKWVILAGPAVSGALVSGIGWRAVFVAMALSGIAAFAGVARTRSETGKPAHTRLDVAGSALLVFGLTALVFAMIAEPRTGFAGFRVWLGAVAGLFALAAFALVERRRGRPGVGISDREGRPRVIALIRPGSLTALTLYTSLVYAASGGLVFFLLIQLQTVAEYSPLGAGAVLPATGILLLLGLRRRGLISRRRLTARRRLILGPVLTALGTLALYRVGPNAVYWRDVLPGTIVAGVGLATFLPPLESAVRRAYTVDLAAARIGQLLAVAALPMLAGLVGAAYANPVAFHHGYRVALVWCAGLFVTGALTALLVRTTLGPGKSR
jgi:MFS family permease